MSDTSKGFLAIIVVACVITLGIWGVGSHNRQITAWAASNRYSVVSIERVWFDNDSPFWRQKGDDLCRVVLEDGDHQKKISFFRWSLFGMDQAWKK